MRDRTNNSSQAPSGSCPDLLASIVAATHHEVRLAEKRCSKLKLESMARARNESMVSTETANGTRFVQALTSGDHFKVIAECKRRSPSKGVLRTNYLPDMIAYSYENSGAVAISVLTEQAFFDGHISHLETVREQVSLPVLRKDFIVTDYQVVEARAAGADAVLLIVAALNDDELAQFIELGRQLSLDSLVEVHTEVEVQRAIDCGATIIGVNNRNLRTLEVNLDTSFNLISKIPKNLVTVAESGISAPEDLTALRRSGYDAFLIGESLLADTDPGKALESLLSLTELHRRRTDKIVEREDA